MNNNMIEFARQCMTQLLSKPGKNKKSPRVLDPEDMIRIEKVLSIYTDDKPKIKILDITEKERCILCKNETQYLKGTHIDIRKNYVEGAGQLCDECYDKVYEEN